MSKRPRNHLCVYTSLGSFAARHVPSVRRATTELLSRRAGGGSGGDGGQRCRSRSPYVSTVTTYFHIIAANINIKSSPVLLLLLLLPLLPAGLTFVVAIETHSRRPFVSPLRRPIDPGAVLLLFRLALVRESGTFFKHPPLFFFTGSVVCAVGCGRVSEPESDSCSVHVCVKKS